MLDLKYFNQVSNLSVKSNATDRKLQSVKGWKGEFNFQKDEL